MFYKKGNYKYQLAEKESFFDLLICPKDNIITDLISLTKSGILFIQEGYAWDGPSGPTIDTKTFMRGSLAHDALYQLMRMGLLDRFYKEDADRLLQKICIEDGMWKMRAWWVYRGVKLGGNTSTDPKNAKKLIQAP